MIPIEMIKSITDVITIENTTVTESATAIKTFVIRLSENGSIAAAVILSSIIIIHIFIIGTAAMEITVIIPAVPTAFFKRLVPERTVSIVSDKIPPTTGTKLPTANFILFIVTLFTAAVPKP